MIKSLISSALQKMIPARRSYAGSCEQIAFIVGTGRCGSTILAQVLNAHSRICVPPELQFIIRHGQGDRLYEKYLTQELRRYKAKDFIKLVRDFCPYNLEKFFDYRRHFAKLKYPQADVRTIVREFFDHLCFERGKQVLCEQTPWHGQHLITLQKLFPEMKVIHILRDGRDVSFSYAKTPWWSTNVHENMKQWEREILAIHQFGCANSGQYVAVRYEDLVAEPRKELEKILALLGLAFEEQMLNPRNLFDYFSLFKDNNLKSYYSDNYRTWDKKPAEVFFQGSVYSWKRNKTADVGLMTDRSRDTLALFGYEV